VKAQKIGRYKPLLPPNQKKQTNKKQKLKQKQTSKQTNKQS
jgi:hypothetical protein